MSPPPTVDVAALKRTILEESARRAPAGGAPPAPPAPPAVHGDEPPPSPRDRAGLVRCAPLAFEWYAFHGLHANELEQFDGDDFVRTAYRALLRRDPTDQDLSYFRELLYHGTPKHEVLATLLASPEGQAFKTPVRGLGARSWMASLYRIPLVGRLLRVATSLWRLPEEYRAALRFQFYAGAQILKLQRLLDDLSGSTSNVLCQLSDRMDQERREADQRFDAQAALARDAGAEAERRMFANEDALRAARAEIDLALDQRSQALDAHSRLLGQLEEREALLQQATDRLDPLLSSTVATVQGLSRTVEALESLRDDAIRQEGSLQASQERCCALERRVAGELAPRLYALAAEASAAAAGQGQGLRQQAERTAALKQELALLSGRVDVLLEATRRSPSPGTSPAPEPPVEFAREARHRFDALLADFVDAFRGSRADIRGRLAVYVPLLRDAGAGAPARPILDLGSGRGEFLDLLRAEGLAARGLDDNRLLVERCRAAGLEVAEADALDHLRALPDGLLGGVTAIHLVEHLPLDDLVALLDQVARVLAPGGVAVFETPNPANLAVGAFKFHFDPTHRAPLPAETLRFLVEARGLCRARVEYLHPVPAEEQVATGDEGGAGAEVARRFNQQIYGPQDYAVVAYKA